MEEATTEVGRQRLRLLLPSLPRGGCHGCCVARGQEQGGARAGHARGRRWSSLGDWLEAGSGVLLLPAAEQVGRRARR